MKIRALLAAVPAVALVIAPVAAQAGTSAKSASYGTYAAPKLAKINGAEGDEKGWAKQNGVWVAMTAAAAAGLGLYFILDDGSNKTPGADD